MLLAHAVAVLHAAAVLLMLTGALLAVRWPRLVLLHAPVALAILAVNLAGADCPLTDLELALRQRAGLEAYEGGFLGHYVFAPLGLDVRDAGSQLGVYATAFGLNALGYGLLLRRAGRTPGEAAGPAQPPARTASSSRRSDSGIVRAIRRGYPGSRTVRIANRARPHS